MSRDVISFEWPVCESGYDWVHVEDEVTARWCEPPDKWPSESPIGPLGGGEAGNVWAGTAVLVGPPYFLAALDDEHERLTDPTTENPNLFLTFATLSERPADLQAFANRWGLLGEPLGNRPRAILEPRLGVILEPVSEWIYAIRNFRFLLFIIRRIADGDEGLLSHYVTWDSPSSVTWRAGSEDPHPLGIQRIISDEVNPEWLAELTPGDVLGPAGLYVKDRVNAALAAQLSVKMSVDPKTRKVGLGLVPRSLLAAMYLQLASALVDAAGFRECVVCSKWFEVSGSYSTRNDRIYCSDACRMRAYRNRRKEANTKRDAQKEEG